MTRRSHTTSLWRPLLMALAALLLLGAGALIPAAAAPSTSAVAAAPAASVIDADVVADTTWTYTGAPYLVVKPITVLAAATLTIEPGVEVRFLPAAGLRVEGGLDAQGTHARQVRMVADNGVAWLGLSVMQPNRNVMLQSTTVAHAATGLAIRQESVAATAATRVDVLDSLFTANVIGIDADYTLEAGAPRLTVRNSLFLKNGVGLVVHGSPQGSIGMKLNHNSFVRNGIGLQTLNATGQGIRARQQWWGSAHGPLVNTAACANPPEPGVAVRDLVCGTARVAPWTKKPSGRMLVPAGAAVMLESALGAMALSDDDVDTTSIVTLTVPLGAFDRPIDLLVAPRNFGGAKPPGDPTLLELEVTAAANGQEIHQFANGKLLRLEFSYTDDDLAGADPSKLKLYYLDEKTGRWSFSGFASLPEPAKHRVVVYLSHLSRMRITAADLTEIMVPLARK
jgi:hypothetical protein